MKPPFSLEQIKRISLEIVMAQIKREGITDAAQFEARVAELCQDDVWLKEQFILYFAAHDPIKAN